MLNVIVFFVGSIVLVALLLFLAIVVGVVLTEVHRALYWAIWYVVNSKTRKVSKAKALFMVFRSEFFERHYDFKKWGDNLCHPYRPKRGDMSNPTIYRNGHS